MLPPVGRGRGGAWGSGLRMDTQSLWIPPNPTPTNSSIPEPALALESLSPSGSLPLTSHPAPPFTDPLWHQPPASPRYAIPPPPRTSLQPFPNPPISNGSTALAAKPSLSCD